MNNIKFQNYSHYKLPITMDPLKYGKLIEQIDNKFIITLTTPTNIAVIKQINNENFVRIYRKGELMFEYKEIKISDIKFIRIISDQRFTFENNKLISTEILSTVSSITIYPLYEDTNAITLNKITPFKFNIDSILDWIDNSKDPLIPFLVWELCLGLFFFIIIVILPDYFLNIDNLTYANLSAGNIIKLRKVQSKNAWNDLIVPTNNKIFSRDLFEKEFNNLWNTVSDQFDGKNHMFILFKIKYLNGDIVTIEKLQRLSKADLNWYIDFIINSMGFKEQYYNETQIDSILFSYGFKKGAIPSKEIHEFKGTQLKYKNFNLPISTKPEDYGKIIFNKKNIFVIQNDKGQTINFEILEHYNSVEYFKNGTFLLGFKDFLVESNKFIRVLANKKYCFENGRQIVTTANISTKFISNIKKSNKILNNFITLDIETFVNKDNNLVPFLISFFNGENSFSFWLGDFKTVEEMMINCFNSILVRKYNGYKIYVHNLAKFDVIFLLKYLVKLGKIEPIIHNDKIISIKLKYGEKENYQIEFKDSYLILLASLLKLGKGFGIKDIKTIFPYLFVNKNNLDYIGKVPDLKYFGNKTDSNDYNKYKSNFKNNWSLKDEAIKYCELDCISLYQIIEKFNELIFDLFSANIHKYPTLPSLAFAIFRSCFMKEKNIPQLSGKIEKDIRSGYTGGAVDMYITRGKNIKCYDVNSLYPFIMHSCPMPVGKPTYFEGDITKMDPQAFGYFYCKIIAPDDIKHPILQTHIKTKNGLRTIAPIGTWEDMLFSQEMYNAKKYGYQFEILWGYTFEKKNIFKDYVDFLYNLRLKYDKSNPLNYIAKILLNSLYGRFGMNDNFPEIDIIHKDYINDFENKFLGQIISKIKLDDHFLVIYESENVFKSYETHNISISIAVAITAYARIHMSQFKNNPKINLFYSDTDSIYTDTDIDKSLIDSKILGKLKLEYICEEAIFLAPKVYCLKLKSGEIIYKAKGLKHEVKLTMNDFENLLFENAFLEKEQNKWIRKLEKGTIHILKQLYTLKVTDNKRQLIYDNNNIITRTKPYKIDFNKILDYK